MYQKVQTVNANVYVKHMNSHKEPIQMKKTYSGIIQHDNAPTHVTNMTKHAINYLV